MISNYSFETFDTAEKNMAFDEAQLHELAPQTRHIRLYKWQTRGLTFRKGLTLPSDLGNLDHSTRITGGGIVFHAPDDLVFSICSWVDDPVFNTKLKEKMKVVRDWFKTSLANLGVQLAPPHSTETNIQFCASYTNPYELTYKNQKCLAITLKRHGKKLIIQGICHLRSNRHHFDISHKYTPFLTDGLQDTALQTDTLSKTLITQFKNLLK